MLHTTAAAAALAIVRIVRRLLLVLLLMVVLLLIVQSTARSDCRINARLAAAAVRWRWRCGITAAGDPGATVAGGRRATGDAACAGRWITATRLGGGVEAERLVERALRSAPR